RREDASPRVGVLLEFPARRAGLGIDGAHRAFRPFLWHWEKRAADEEPSRAIRRLQVFIRHERIALLVTEEIEQARAGTVGRRVPVRASGPAWADSISCGGRLGIGKDDRAAAGVDFLRPRDLRIGFAEEIGSGDPIEDVE